MARSSPVFRSRAGAPVFALALTGMVIGASAGCESARPRPAVDASPAFRGTTLAGEPLGLDDLRGQVVLVNLWATWCVPCREELPELQRLHEELGPRGLTILGISEDAPRLERQVRMMVQQFGLTYPNILDPQAQAQRVFRADGYPTSVLLGRRGQELWRRAGLVEPYDAELRTQLEAALSAPPP